MTSSEQALTKEVHALRDAFERKMPTDVQRIEGLWKKLLFVKWESEVYRLLQRLVRSLRGTALSYGFESLSQLANQLQGLLASHDNSGAPPKQAIREGVTGIIEQMTVLAAGDGMEVAASPVEPAAFLSMTDAGRGDVFVLDDDCELSQLVRAHLEHQHFTVRCFSSPDDMRAAIHETAPVAMVVDAVLESGALAGIELVSRLGGELSELPPVVFVSSRGDLEARMAAVRAGGLGFFTKPLDLDAIAKRLDKLVMNSAGQAARVLVVENDKKQIDYYALVLGQAGIMVDGVTGPAQLLEKLERLTPDLVLMDLHLADCSGSELAKIIRQDPRFEDMPIVFMSSGSGGEEELDILRDGCDGMLRKPVDANHLVAVVAGRVRRAKETAQRIQFLNKRDLVTGLYNRPYFMRALSCIQERSPDETSPVALLYLEIDDFHSVRERVGLAAADLLIADVADIINHYVEHGDIAARFGDASCTMLLNGRDFGQLELLAAELAAAVAQPVYQVGGKTVVITASIGVVVMDRQDVVADEWVNRTAALCDQARESGGVMVRRDEQPGDSSDEVDDANCRQRLQAALDSNGFYLVFQPIASLRGDRAERYELLLRLHDENGAEVLPARFLPIATRHEMMTRIDRWVVEEGMRRLAERPVGQAAVFYIKVSQDTMRDSDFIPWLSSRLVFHRITAGKLVIELDESMVADFLNEATVFVNELKSLGCGVGLEHYGTHFNASQLLQHVHADFVKIDGSFMHDLTVNTDNQAALRAIVEGASQQRAMIIAGFVEDAASLNVLWQTGVQYIQGNFLQEPDDMLAFDFSEVFA